MSVTLQDMQNALSTLGMTLESSPEIRQLAEKVRAEGGRRPRYGRERQGTFFQTGAGFSAAGTARPSASLSAGGG